MKDVPVPVVQEQSKPTATRAADKSVDGTMENGPSTTDLPTLAHTEPASSSETRSSAIYSAKSESTLDSSNTATEASAFSLGPSNKPRLASHNGFVDGAITPSVPVTMTPTCRAQFEEEDQSTLLASMTETTETMHDTTPSLHKPSETITVEGTPTPIAETPADSSGNTTDSQSRPETSSSQAMANGETSPIADSLSRPSTTSTPSTAAPSPTPSIPLHVPFPPAATGGESIYRTIMNRLTALEANHTLYARYVEEQTAGVRDLLRRLGEDVGRVEAIVRIFYNLHWS